MILRKREKYYNSKWIYNSNGNRNLADYMGETDNSVSSKKKTLHVTIMTQIFIRSVKNQAVKVRESGTNVNSCAAETKM